LAVTGLDISDFKPNLTSMSLRESLGIVLIVIIVFFMLFIGISVPLIIKSKGMKGIIICISIVFLLIISAILAAYFLTIKKKPVKRHEQ
jgi:uncharacterized YccA/Bax inhibitor family protein